MPYNEELARRLREHLSSQHQVTEQEMFGGISFMIAGNMCCGVLDDDVVVRIDPTLHHDALTRPGVSEFEMGGRTSKGMVRVGPAGTTEDLDLALWVRLGVNHATELPPKKAGKKGAAARKRGGTTPAKKAAPARKKATPAKKKTAPAKKKGSARTRPAPLKKKAAVVKRAASVKKTSVRKAGVKKSAKRAPAGKKGTKATRAKKVAKGKGPGTRK